MCQLLGMNCNTPTDILFSFSGFSERGGCTDHHADGWGIAFFQEKACQTFIDTQSAATSPVAALVKAYPIKSKNVIAHIRKATQGAITLENCHPFMREAWGRHWIFAHNGDLKNFAPPLDGFYSPVGDTDSEIAFCYIMQNLRARFGTSAPDSPELFQTLLAYTRYIRSHGPFNFMLSDGRALFVHCSTSLHYVIRQFPFKQAHLSDADLTVDFAALTTNQDRVAIIATQPLTDNEQWTTVPPGTMLMFKEGQIELHMMIKDESTD